MAVHTSSAKRGDVIGQRAYAGTGLPRSQTPWPWEPLSHGNFQGRELEPERGYMARRKSGHFNQRVDPDNRKLWQACADEAGLPLATWMECVLNREVPARRRARLLETIYPNRALRR